MRDYSDDPETPSLPWVDPTRRRACNTSGRMRWVGFNCGLATPDPEHWPICTGLRVGNWTLDPSPGLGPYSPDTILLGTIPCEFVSAGLYRSELRSSAVKINARNSFTGGVLTDSGGVVIGTYIRYYEIVFSGEAAGDVVLTAHTIEHPDARFPESVEWTNTLALADSSTLSLTSSTQFADAVELMPFLLRDVVLNVATADEHGQPYFNADGTFNDTYHHDPLFSPSWRGEINCHYPLGAEGTSRLCGTFDIDTWPIYCYPFGGPLTEFSNSLSGDIAATGTAYDGGSSNPAYLGLDAGLCFSAGVSAGTLWGNLSVTWEADCDGVTVTATAAAKYVAWTSSERVVTWVWTGLPFDWWQTTLVQTATTTVTKPDGSTVEQATELTLTLFECDYYTGGGDPGDECYDSLCIRWTTETRDSVAEEIDGEGHASRTWFGPDASLFEITVDLVRVSGPDAEGVTTWTLTIEVNGEPHYGPFERTITSTCVGGVPLFDYWEGFSLEGVHYFEIDLGCGEDSGENRPCLAQPIYVTNGPITSEFYWTDPNERSVPEYHIVGGHTIVTTYSLSYVSGPTPPLDTVWWELRVTVYDQTAATILCDETYDLSGYCDEDDVFQMSAEISICSLSLLIHAGS